MAKPRRGSQVTGFTSPARDVLGHFMSILRSNRESLPTFYNGTNMDTNEPFYWDPIAWKKDERCHSKVEMAFAAKGQGKTAQAMAEGILMAVNNMAGDDIHIAVDDVRRNDSTSEYGKFAEFFDSKPILFSEKLNVFDAELGFNDSENLETAVELFTYANDEVLPTANEFFVLQVAVKTLFTEWPKWASVDALIDIILDLNEEDINNYHQRRLEAQALSDLASGETVPDELLKRAKSRGRFDNAAVMQAADIVGKRMLRLVNGDFDDHFGGRRSFAGSLQQTVAMVDYSGLSTRTIALMQSLFWRLRKSAEGRNDKRYIYHYEIHDENYDFWNHLPYAEGMSKHLKRIRGKATTARLNTHRPQDYFTVGTPDSRQRMLATNVFGDVGIWQVGRQETANDVNAIGDLLMLQDSERNRLSVLRKGQFGIKIGTEPMQFIDTNTAFTEQLAAISQSNTSNDKLYVT